MNCAFILILGVSFNIAAAVVRYDNHALYRIIPQDVESVNTLRSLQNSEKYSFWTYPRGIAVPVDVLVPPEQKTQIEKIIMENKMDFKILIDNIQENIDEEKRNNTLRQSEGDDFTWDTYYDLNAINNWLKKLAEDHPDIVTLLEGGSTYENRTIYGVKVSFGPQNKHRGVWIDSNIHAREWISGATNTYILNAVLTSTDLTIRRVAESHDWYIFPVINPDGFQYSHTTARFWRKNRNPPYGVDLNRNWDYKWDQQLCPNKGADDYCGTAPFSEIETRSLANFISSIAENLMVLISFHSYSQLLMVPYGDSTNHLDNYNVTYPIAVKATESLAKRYGTKYLVGTPPELLYACYGVSMDWAKATHHIPFVYTYELRDTGNYGFVLPTDQIIPTALETLDSIITILEEADKQFFV